MYRLEAKACAGEGIEEVRGLAPKCHGAVVAAANQELPGRLGNC
jgi:hypothetical protein